MMSILFGAITEGHSLTLQLMTSVPGLSVRPVGRRLASEGQLINDNYPTNCSINQFNLTMQQHICVVC